MTNSKQKGKRGELEACHFLRQRGVYARRSQQYKGTAESADVISDSKDPTLDSPGHWQFLDNLHIEVKRVQRLNIPAAHAKAAEESPAGKMPVVMHRQNNKPWLITLSAEDFLRLHRGWRYMWKQLGEDNGRTTT